MRAPDPLRPHREALLAGLARHGVVRVWAFGGVGVVWVGVETDAQLAALDRGSPLLHEVRAILLAEGVDPALVQQVRTAGLSAEAVDRDHGGDWFRAMR